MAPGVSVPGIDAQDYGTVESGSTTQLYFGLTLRASEKTKWAIGYNAWSIPLSVQYGGSGTISYKGAYFRYNRTGKYLYATGGLDVSFQVDENLNSSNSKLQNFYNQVNFVLGGGPRVEIGKVTLEAFLGASVQFSSVNDSGTSVQQVYIPSGQPAPTDNDVNLHFLPAFQYGFSIQYNLYNFNK